MTDNIEVETQNNETSVRRTNITRISNLVALHVAIVLTPIAYIHSEYPSINLVW